MKESIQHIAEELKKAREKKGLSQRELGQKIGVPQGHISNIENGKVDLQLSSFLELARALDFEPMLIPRPLIITVETFLKYPTSTKQIPAYRLEEDDDEET